MVKGIAKGVGNCRAPGFEFLKGIGIACAKVLGYTICSHGTPFVMIALKPDREEVRETPVVGNVCRREVAVVVDDGQWRSDLVVKALCRFALKQEIIVNEVHGRFSIANGKEFVSAKGVKCMCSFNVPRWIPLPR